MHKTKRQRRTHKRRQRKSQRGGGSDFNVPIRSFYPQNQYLVDPLRMAVVGGGGDKKRKNHSRKYLRKGGSSWGFLGNFGTTSGALSNATTLTGVSAGPANITQRILV